MSPAPYHHTSRPERDAPNPTVAPAARVSTAARGPGSDARALQRAAGNQAVQARLANGGGFAPLAAPTSPRRATDPLHNSPPTSGPGSRGEPLAARGRTQRMSRLRIDAYYRSSVNPKNPVLVWTDGTNLFFAPTAAQIAAGRAATPEPTFAPPPGYTIHELHWDRRRGLTANSSLLVVARRAGAPELQVIVTNTLHQIYSYQGTGATSMPNVQVSRQGDEFMMSNATAVPASGTRTGGIHSIAFPDGFFRYRASSGDHDVYVDQRANPPVYVVQRSTGAIIQRFAGSTVRSVIPEAGGRIVVELQTGRTTAVRSTVTIDLRASPPTITRATGHPRVAPGEAAARRRLARLGVRISERGSSWRLHELLEIEGALLLGGRRGLNALAALRRRRGHPTSSPLLEVLRSLGQGGGSASILFDPPLLNANEPFTETVRDHRATIRHEMTHIVVEAINEDRKQGRTRRQRANHEGAMRYEARRGRRKARRGLLRSNEYGLGDRVPPVASRSTWRDSVGEDPELAAIWVELLRRYSFLPDPEGTGERRGVSLADESQYLGGDETVGHPADNVGEFIASFVTSARMFRARFVANVLAAQAAGNARGGRGGSYVRGLYRRSWNRISALYVPLGSNPF